VLRRAKILLRTETHLSPWVRLVTKEVTSAATAQPQTYHALVQPDYVAILARSRGGLIPIVRQYRPAVEAYTWELPAGLLEPGEDPQRACRRELKEETGLEATSVVSLGWCYADTGRLENRLHAFFAVVSEPDPHFISEPGLSVAFVDQKRLQRYILNGTFRHQLHLGVLASAYLAGYWK